MPESRSWFRPSLVRSLPLLRWREGMLIIQMVSRVGIIGCFCRLMCLIHHLLNLRLVVFINLSSQDTFAHQIVSELWQWVILLDFFQFFGAAIAAVIIIRAMRYKPM